MELKELIKSLSIKQTLGNCVQEITGVNMDSRLIKPGHLFVAVKGTQTDGHAYIAKAIEKGATTIVCEE
ncbi:MAG: Mur ligase domain-containing protein, partial [Bacteroides sp.]